MSDAQHAEIVPASTLSSIAEYSKTAAGLAELREKYAGKFYDTTTPQGMKLAKLARGEIKGLRVGLEKMRVEIKAPALERCRQIDAEAKRITVELEALEAPIDRSIKIVEEREAEEKAARERAEVERIAAIGRRIEDVRRSPLGIIGKSADQIDELRVALAGLDFSDMDPADRQLAGDARATSLATMTAAHDAAAKAENEAVRLHAERAELEALRAKQEADLAEQRRIADEAQRAEREKDNAERAEADRLARAERERLDAEAARGREEARQRILAEQAELDRKIAAQRADETERARAEAEAEQARQAEAEAQAIASASLVDAAKDALAMLADLDQEETLTFRTLQAAIERAEA